MVYLIGTNHELQHTRPPKRGNPDEVWAARDELKGFLAQVCRENRIAIVAEELCEQLLRDMNAASILQEVAGRLGLKHIFCDPDFKERERLGIPAIGTEDLPESEKPKYMAAREEYWFKCIEADVGFPTLFVCGAEHVRSFQRLLESKSLPVKVLIPYWGEHIYETIQGRWSPTLHRFLLSLPLQSVAVKRGSSPTLGVSMDCSFL